MSKGSVRYRVEWGAALGLFACLAVLPSLAHARTINVELAADAIIWIGEVADLGGGQFVVTADASRNTCRWYEIGGTAGLSDDVRINGTTRANSFHFMQAQGVYRICGLDITWRPIKHNGRYVVIAAGAGDDTISSSTDGSSSTFAGAGDDWTYARSLGGARHTGDDGNDKMFAMTSTNLLFGGGQNDLFCLDRYYARADFVDGGDAIDTRCGDGLSGSVYSVERSSCDNACRPF
jgi:hypothetical protein